MNYKLKTNQTLSNCSNDGKSPLDTNWNKNDYLDLKIGDEVILQKEVYSTVTIYRISTRIDGVKFHKTI